MSSKVKGDQKGVIATATGFQGVASVFELSNGNIFDKGTLRTLD
jgi:hypothetical protein